MDPSNPNRVRRPRVPPRGKNGAPVASCKMPPAALRTARTRSTRRAAWVLVSQFLHLAPVCSAFMRRATVRREFLLYILMIFRRRGSANPGGLTNLNPQTVLGFRCPGTRVCAPGQRTGATVGNSITLAEKTPAEDLELVPMGCRSAGPPPTTRHHGRKSRAPMQIRGSTLDIDGVATRYLRSPCPLHC